MRHSHGTLVMRSLLPGEYNLTVEATNGFGGVDRSPVVCPFQVLALDEAINQTQVSAREWERERKGDGGVRGGRGVPSDKTGMYGVHCRYMGKMAVAGRAKGGDSGDHLVVDATYQSSRHEGKSSASRAEKHT